jgi:hypothetical protein
MTTKPTKTWADDPVGETSTNTTISTGGNPPPDESSTFSTNSTGVMPDLSAAIYPECSLIERYMDFARGQLESADSYIIGAFLPVMARVVARKVWFQWGNERIHPNLFTILAGKPGDRKTSAISLAQRLANLEVPDAGRVLPPSAFLTSSLSSESLFDEYDEARGGCADKLLIEDEGNIFLGNITKSQYGERVGQRLLSLYDCKPLSENFRRNTRDSDDDQPEGRRVINETSTSILLGATFNVANFRGAEIRAGLQRRFIYYLAEDHGRFMALPPEANAEELIRIAGRLWRLKSHYRGAFKLAPGAVDLWTHIQKENRRKLKNAKSEAEAGRLNGEPMHILKVSMLFALSMDCNPHSLVIDVDDLDCASRHVTHCNAAAGFMEVIGEKESIRDRAEILLARIRADFHSAIDSDGWIRLSRSAITAKYAPHSDRKGALTPHEIYNLIIPALRWKDLADLDSKNGKAEIWRFRADGE